MDKPTPSLLPPLGARTADASQIDAPQGVAYAPVARVGAAFMLAHPAHLIGLGFGSGLSRLAPGTVGTLWAWLAFLAWRSVNPSASVGLEAAILAVTLLLSVWASTRTAQHMGVADPSPVVIDEIVAFWLVLWLVCPAGSPHNFGVQLAAFALFRFFDAVKPPPVSWADRAFKGFGWRGGFGIVLDDLVAAFCTLLVLAWWVR